MVFGIMLEALAFETRNEIWECDRICVNLCLNECLEVIVDAHGNLNTVVLPWFSFGSNSVVPH